MIRRLVILALLTWLPSLQAAEVISPRVAQRLFAIMEQAADDPSRALEELQDALQSRSMSATEKGYIAYERAGLLIQQGQSSVARQELQALLAGDGVIFIPRLRRLYAQLLLMDDEPELALEQLEIWLEEVEEPQPAELVMVGYTYLQLERFSEAAQVLERAINTSENPQPQWSELLAYAYTRTGRTDAAIELLDALILEQPDQARWWRQLASVYLLIEDIPKGTAGLVIASTVEDMSYEDARRLAGLFTTLGMPADAATLFSRAMQRNAATDPEAIDFDDQMLLGEMWMLARELELAVAAFDAAARIETGSSEPYLKTAQLYLQWERYREARDALLKASRAAGEDTPAQINYLLAIAEINLGDLQAAGDAVLRIRDDPDYAERAERLDRYLINARQQP